MFKLLKWTFIVAFIFGGWALAAASLHVVRGLIGVLVLWLFVYYAYPWATSGKTFGMAVLGIRVVTAQGAPAGARNAVVRTLTFG